ncbi:ABC transporter substrate-binding protein [Anaeroselena agilis]|uniref:ABC transporter substrate-binding protein n=1 Tax=Anaeroselena agilis TaxID=3063788 RepID=A0ABU3P390_9FIRM|nr:ABC transporter substrate-binding protein [Selenomonadales bacterium 4137-cl]
MKRSKLAYGLFILVFLAVVSLGAQPCYSKPLETIKIGALLPLSGDWSEAGRGAQAALAAGVGQVNHYLAASGLRLEIDIRDTEGKPAKALAELASLAQQGTRIAIGPMSSEEAKVLNEYASGHSILLVSPSATATELSKKDNFFRVIPTDWNQADGLIKIMDREGVTHFAVVYYDDVFGRGFCEQMKTAALKSGKQMLGGIPLASSPDYVSTAGELDRLTQTADPAKTAIVLIGPGKQAAEFVKSVSPASPAAGMKWFAGAEIIGSKDFVADKSVAAFAAGARMEGLSIGYNGIALDALPSINYFLNGAADISPFALTTWDSLWLIAETCRQNPEADVDALKATLTATAKEFRNSYGLINTMDDNGDTVSARFMRYQLYATGNGNYDWRCKGHYVNPSISAPFIRTIEPGIAKNGGVVRVGAILPLRGDTALEGKEVQAVLELAAASFNKYASDNGSGIKIELVVEDTASNPQTAKAVTRKLLDQGVKNFIGAVSSSELAAVEPLLRSRDALAISPMSTAPSLSKKDHIYRLIMNDGYQAQALASLAKRDGIKNVVVLYRDEVYGQDLLKTFSAAYDGKVFPLGYNAGDGNLDQLLARAEQLVASAGEDNTAVLVIAYNEITEILRLKPDSNLNSVPWYGTDSIALQGALCSDGTAAGVAARVGLTAVGYSAYGNYFDPLYHVINYQLADKIHHQIKESSVAAFDALWMIGCAYLENGAAADNKKIAAYVQKAVFRGVSGLVALDAYGDRSIGYYRIYRFNEAKDGQYRWTNIGLYSLDYAKKGIIEINK